MFRSDLQFGQRYEKEALRILGDGETTTAPNDKAFSAWDFIHKGVAYEVKSDRRAYTTGNLCIEYQHTGIPSGISLSQADFWLYFIVTGQSYILLKIPTEVLRTATVGARRSYTDGGNSQFYLIPYKQFLEYEITQKSYEGEPATSASDPAPGLPPLLAL